MKQTVESGKTLLVEQNRDTRRKRLPFLTANPHILSSEKYGWTGTYGKSCSFRKEQAVP